MSRYRIFTLGSSDLVKDFSSDKEMLKLIGEMREVVPVAASVLLLKLAFVGLVMTS